MEVVLQTLLALGLVGLLAWLLLRAMAQRGFIFRASGGQIRVIERTVLEGRRVLYLVQGGKRVFLLGASESGPLVLLAELDASQLPTDLAATSASAFHRVLHQVQTEPQKPTEL